MSPPSIERELKLLCGEEELKEILKAAGTTPDPDFFLLYFLKVAEAVGGTAICSLFLTGKGKRLLLPLLSSSRYVSEILIRRPELFQWLFLQENYATPLELDELLEEITDRIGLMEEEQEASRFLRSVRDREILRIAIRDLSGLAEVEETGTSLSDLAEATLCGAVSFACSHFSGRYGRPVYMDEGGNERECGYCVLALGKFGGRELNFSSDIDIMYIYESDRGTTHGTSGGDGVTLHQFFIKVSEMVTRLIGEITEEGIVFRVDLRLRPDGTRGPLANSIRGLESYYEAWGQTWERAVLIKGRPVAGDRQVGDRALNILTPFVYRKYLDFVAIDEVKELKKRIDITLKLRLGDKWDVKLGEGGIREIEFFIQAHQLIFGGKHPEIREKNTLKGLAALRSTNFISPREAEEIAVAYRFLRNLEHRVQMLGGFQTQRLPEGPDLFKIAYMMGFNSMEEFEKELERVKSRVRSVFGKLFAGDKEEGVGDVKPEVISLLYGDIPEEKRKEVLSSMGFLNPTGVLENLEHLRYGPQFSRLSERARKYLRSIAPVVLSEAAKTPDPDMALGNIEAFLQAIGARTTFYALLSENPSILSPLVQLFGSSQYLSRYFVNHPELVDVLLQRGQSLIFKDRSTMRAELGEALVMAEDYEDELAILRRYRNEEFLRIGIHTLGENLSLEELSVELSALAEVTMGYALYLAMREVGNKYGVPMYEEGGERKESRFAVLALGKFGGEELNFHSDLDIIFIFSHTGETDTGIEGEGPERRKVSNQEFFARVAQRFISVLSTVTREGHVYKVDMRMRPSGSAGPLVTSFDSFKKYYSENAWIFEKQALLKSRFAAGDRELGKEISSWISRFLYYEPPPDDLRARVGELRERMEKELGKERNGYYNVKFGKGGLIDVEFLVQFLQLLHGETHRGVRTQNTLKALFEFNRAGVLSDEEFSILNEGYRFLRQIEVSLRLVHDTSVERFQPDDRGLMLLQFSSLEEFHENYVQVTAGIRSCYEKFLKG